MSNGTYSLTLREMREIVSAFSLYPGMDNYTHTGIRKNALHRRSRKP